MKDRKYVIAVSGGVDSMVLLDALMHNRLSELTNYQLPTTNYQLVIAHFDHGIREDSAEDEMFVRGIAKKHGLQYESERVELGIGASEDEARKARYSFLRRCCNNYNASLMTAHHQDDVLETMIINLIRGTGWRGLAPMGETPNSKSQSPNNIQKSIINNQTLRPLIDVSKQKVLDYAKKYNVKWREDSTNTDTAYLRNYVRHILFPAMGKKDSAARRKLVDIYKTQTALKKEIATELQKSTINHQPSTINYIVPRHKLIMFPRPAAQELIHHIVTCLDPHWHPNAAQITKVLHFIKTAKSGKSMDVTKRVRAICTIRVVEFLVNDA